MMRRATADPWAGRRIAEAGQTLKLAVSRDRILAYPGQLDLLTSYACLKRARLFIGNDSGAMHLAAAAGAPTLGLFGPIRRSPLRALGTQGQGPARAARSGDHPQGRP